MHYTLNTEASLCLSHLYKAHIFAENILPVTANTTNEVNSLDKTQTDSIKLALDQF